MKVGIIGGGAAGMTAAITAAKNGFDVTILEHQKRIGKKILVTGNGRCNLTNIDQHISHYHGAEREFAGEVFASFDYKETIAFFTKLGLYTKNKNGCLYPYSEQASSVLEVLRMELKRLGVIVLTECNVTNIHKEDKFFLDTNQGCFSFDRIIIAAGSKAAPQTGSDGSGYKLAKSLGHHIRKPLPALVQLRSKEPYFKRLTGIRTEACLTIYCNHKKAGSERGELQLTGYGLSGIPTLQLSYLASMALDKKEKVIVEIDFIPDMDSTVLRHFLMDRIQMCPNKTAEEFLIGVLHKNFASFFIELCGIKQNTVVGNFSSKQIEKLSLIMKKFEVPIDSVNSFQEAQICCGGVDTTQLKPTLESKLINGLFFAGEIIDIHGDCGGYNLQWAWSSGTVAGRMIQNVTN